MKKNVFLFCVFILSTGVFKFSLLTGMQQRFLFYPLLILMLFIIIKKRAFHKRKLFFKWPIILITLCMVLSSIPCYIYYNQGILDSLIALPIFVLPYFLYFYLHAVKTSERDLLYIFFLMSVITVCIQIIQQFYPQYALFGIDTEDTVDEIAMRNGLYRFRVNYNGIFTFPILFYMWATLMKKFSWIIFISFLFFLSSIYLALTRQVYVAVALGLFLYVVLYNKKVNKLYLFLSLIVVGVAMFYYFDSLFGELMQKSVDQVTNEDYIRYRSWDYFYKESLKTPLNIMFGHGVPRGGSPYDAFIKMLGEVFHFYSSDVGLVGAAYKYGYIYILLFYYVQFICIWKFRKFSPAYIILTIIAMTIYSIMLFMINLAIGSMVWVSMLYIIDLHENKSPQRMELKSVWYLK